jgi:hypothetical protein
MKTSIFRSSRGFFFLTLSFLAGTVLGVDRIALCDDLRSIVSETSRYEDIDAADARHIVELTGSEEGGNSGAIAELRERSRKSPALVRCITDLVQDKDVSPHVRVELFKLVLEIDVPLNRSVNMFTEIARDRSEADVVRGIALEPLIVLSRRSGDTKAQALSLAIAQDKSESAALRLYAIHAAIMAGGESETAFSVTRRMFRDPTEDLELRTGLASVLPLFRLLVPEETKSIAATLLDVGGNSNSAHELRLSALKACWNVVLFAEFFGHDRVARASLHRFAISALLNESENLAIRVASGELLVALHRPDKAIVDDLITVLKSEYFELQEVAIRILRDIGPDARKARPYLIEMRKRSNVDDRICEIIDEALQSLAGADVGASKQRRP